MKKKVVAIALSMALVAATGFVLHTNAGNFDTGYGVEAGFVDFDPANSWEFNGGTPRPTPCPHPGSYRCLCPGKIGYTSAPVDND